MSRPLCEHGYEDTTCGVCGDAEAVARAWEKRNASMSDASLTRETARADRAEARIQELLQAMTRLTREIPYPEEAASAATLIAEVGTLLSRLRETEAAAAELRAVLAMSLDNAAFCATCNSCLEENEPHDDTCRLIRALSSSAGEGWVSQAEANRQADEYADTCATEVRRMLENDFDAIRIERDTTRAEVERLTKLHGIAAERCRNEPGKCWCGAHSGSDLMAPPVTPQGTPDE